MIASRFWRWASFEFTFESGVAFEAPFSRQRASCKCSISRKSMPTYFHNVFCFLAHLLPLHWFGLGWCFSRFFFKHKIAPLTNPPQLCLIISSHDSPMVIRIVYDGRVIFTMIIIWASFGALLQLWFKYFYLTALLQCRWCTSAKSLKLCNFSHSLVFFLEW